jgi:hypothetical protein
MPMTHRQGRIGAGIAGGLLLAISIADVLLGTDNPSAVNIVTGILGAAFLMAAFLARGRHSSSEDRS